MDRFKRLLATVMIVCGCALLFSCQTQLDDRRVQSPNGAIALIFENSDTGIYYRVDYQDKPLIGSSKLGMILKDQSSLQSNFRVVNAQHRHFNETWEQPWGESKTVVNHYHELSIELQEKEAPNRRLDVVFRAFDDGIAFRYVFPEQDGLHEFVIADELTQFNVLGDFTTWSIPAYRSDRYEYLYREQELQSVADTVHTPFTLVNNRGVALSIHEANLTDYASMALFVGEDQTINCDLIPWSNGDKVYVTALFKTPWRTIQIAKEEHQLGNSQMILNLNEPCKIEDVSWIEPAKYIGIWWEMHINKSTWGQGNRHGANTKNVKKYMDFAADNGFKGVLVEGWNIGWDGDWWQDGSVFNFTQPYPDFDIDEITEYGRKKGVGLIGHHETGAAVKNYESQLPDAMSFYQAHGVRYVKTGYVNPEGMDRKEFHHSQFGVRHYRKAVQEAAKHNVMICAHEAIKPTGIRRTYPNMMTRESARGQEFNAWSGDGGNPPNHETILAFTRMLAGPMDFTPGIFDLELPTQANNQVNTTLAKQLALYVVLYSPLQMAADLPENYKDQPAFQLIKDVPVDWNQSKVLDGAIGDFVVTARQDRNSDRWFLGAISNEEARDLSISLEFLDPHREYKATIYKDGKDAHYSNNPQSINIVEQRVNASQQLGLHIAEGGGAALMFEPIE